MPVSTTEFLEAARFARSLSEEYLHTTYLRCLKQNTPLLIDNTGTTATAGEKRGKTPSYFVQVPVLYPSLSALDGLPSRNRRCIGKAHQRSTLYLTCINHLLVSFGTIQTDMKSLFGPRLYSFHLVADNQACGLAGDTVDWPSLLRAAFMQHAPRFGYCSSPFFSPLIWPCDVTWRHRTMPVANCQLPFSPNNRHLVILPTKWATVIDCREQMIKYTVLPRFWSIHSGKYHMIRVTDLVSSPPSKIQRCPGRLSGVRDPNL
ncbi:hypothetical protein ACRALDRAFT_212900 [Sodiomyces alcalophilus JCM 7366]|uniref:uncharacterized protein n=1 Tax=Sodiomyces alcalophilus JCM 7366 TaxID=591952 RepID=UPI0039B41C9E